MTIHRKDSGQTFVEYAIVLVIIAAVVIGALFALSAASPDDAEAAPPPVSRNITVKPPAPAGTPIACILAWYRARPGHKFEAMQKCIAAYCATKPRWTPAFVRVKGERVDRGQAHVLSWLVNEAVRRKLPRGVLVSAIATTTQEASAREIGYGHSSSVGPFQLIDIHGTAAQRQTIEYSGNWFYNGAMKVWYAGIDPVFLSHKVQRSAHPTAVAQWIPEARRTFRYIMRPCPYPNAR